MTVARLPKRERTRAKLIAAGLEVLARRGEALTAADVVAEAEVSNGTFYNHFEDRDAFLHSLATESLRALTAASAEATAGEDPAWRFAVATAQALITAQAKPLWARAVLRLAEWGEPPQEELAHYLRTDLREGFEGGRFRFGDDTITMDMIVGTLMATLRRMIATKGEAPPPSLTIKRLLELLGLAPEDAETLSIRAFEAVIAKSEPQETPKKWR
jgi:AcrR family transcriptional regulator